MSQSQGLTFVAEVEPMLVYRLEDGTTLRVKVVLMRVEFRGIDKDKKQPIYDLRFQQIMDVEPGPNLVDETAKEKR